RQRPLPGGAGAGAQRLQAVAQGDQLARPGAARVRHGPERLRRPAEWSDLRFAPGRPRRHLGRSQLHLRAQPESLGRHPQRSGTIAGVNGTTAPANGKTPAVTGLTGVAPKAFLGNYNVFPGDLTNATSHDIAQAIEDAVKDGMDVINMSLGGGINGGQDQLTAASNRAANAGVVVAIAAGNSGPGVNTVESPGQAADAITARSEERRVG